MGIGTAFAAPVESDEEDFLAFDGVLEEYIGANGDVGSNTAGNDTNGENDTNGGTYNGTNGNNKNDSNGNSHTVITKESSDNTALIVVVAVIGGAMLLAIFVVVILAATGVLFGKKPTKEVEPEEDPEMAAIKAELEAAKKAKELEALKAELAAIKGEETPEE